MLSNSLSSAVVRGSVAPFNYYSNGSECTPPRRRSFCDRALLKVVLEKVENQKCILRSAAVTWLTDP